MEIIRKAIIEEIEDPDIDRDEDQISFLRRFLSPLEEQVRLDS